MVLKASCPIHCQTSLWFLPVSHAQRDRNTKAQDHWTVLEGLTCKNASQSRFTPQAPVKSRGRSQMTYRNEWGALDRMLARMLVRKRATTKEESHRGREMK